MKQLEAQVVSQNFKPSNKVDEKRVLGSEEGTDDDVSLQNYTSLNLFIHFAIMLIGC